MAITKTKSPYEFLARWDGGKLAGAHIQFLETIDEDGVVLSQKEGPALPVSTAEQEGFPLADILTGIQAQAIAQRDDAIAAKSAAESALSKVQGEHAAALAAKDAEIARLSALLPSAEAQHVRQVTMRQARLALLQRGLLDTVNRAIAAMPGAEGDAARIEWEFSGAVQRDRPLMTSLAAALGLSASQLDDLFELAATL